MIEHGGDGAPCGACGHSWGQQMISALMGV